MTGLQGETFAGGTVTGMQEGRLQVCRVDSDRYAVGTVQVCSDRYAGWTVTELHGGW